MKEYNIEERGVNDENKNFSTPYWLIGYWWEVSNVVYNIEERGVNDENKNFSTPIIFQPVVTIYSISHSYLYQ